MTQDVETEHLVERLVDPLGWDVLNTAVEIEDPPHAVHQGVESTERVDGNLNGFVTGGSGGPVALDHRDVGKLLAKRRALGAVVLENGHLGGLVQERVDGGPTDTRTGSDDQGALANQPARHTSSPRISGAPACPTIAAKVDGFCQVNASISKASSDTQPPDLGA